MFGQFPRGEAKSIKIEYDGSDNPIYIGRHFELNPDEGNTDFEITKLTWTGDVPTFIQIAEGSWTNRASLF